MVKVGFLVEGGCERIVLRSPAFSNFLLQHDIEIVGDVIDMDGKGNLTQSSKRMQSQVQTLRNRGANWIIVLGDLDEAETDEAVSRIKAKVYKAENLSTCLAVQELEAWFVADSDTLSTLFNTPFYHDKPEAIVKPSAFLKEQRLIYTGQGIKDKKGFATAMINNGFSINRAAAHPNCPSARYFLDKLQTIASAN
ncbi:DUF4276 family protein [Fibrella arboris]|uniref:DUF4276 family protein n=1 Tax=Fibrella arboris TaxID=3242486 RepID=UPI0035210468